MSSIKLKHSGGNSVSLNPPSSAPTSSEVAFKLPTSDGSAGQVLQTDGSGNLSWVTLPTGGVAMHDNWYVNGGLDPAGGTNTITANWTRDTRTSVGSIGSAMTQSSGLFTFPSTGIYHLHIAGAFYRNNTSDHKYVGFTIQTTTDNGSNYETSNSSYQFLKGLGANTYTQTECEFVFDVTDVSQCKARFQTESDVGGTSLVDVAGRRLSVTFTKLGDT